LIEEIEKIIDEDIKMTHKEISAKIEKLLNDENEMQVL